MSNYNNQLREKQNEYLQDTFKVSKPILLKPFPQATPIYNTVQAKRESMNKQQVVKKIDSNIGIINRSYVGQKNGKETLENIQFEDEHFQNDINQNYYNQNIQQPLIQSGVYQNNERYLEVLSSNKNPSTIFQKTQTRIRKVIPQPNSEYNLQNSSIYTNPKRSQTNSITKRINDSNGHYGNGNKQNQKLVRNNLTINKSYNNSKSPTRSPGILQPIGRKTYSNPPQHMKQHNQKQQNSQQQQQQQQQYQYQQQQNLNQINLQFQNNQTLNQKNRQLTSLSQNNQDTKHKNQQQRQDKSVPILNNNSFQKNNAFNPKLRHLQQNGTHSQFEQVRYQNPQFNIQSSQISIKNSRANLQPSPYGSPNIPQQSQQKKQFFHNQKILVHNQTIGDKYQQNPTAIIASKISQNYRQTSQQMFFQPQSQQPSIPIIQIQKNNDYKQHNQQMLSQDNNSLFNSQDIQMPLSNPYPKQSQVNYNQLYYQQTEISQENQTINNIPNSKDSFQKNQSQVLNRKGSQKNVIINKKKATQQYYQQQQQKMEKELKKIQNYENNNQHLLDELDNSLEINKQKSAQYINIPKYQNIENQQQQKQQQSVVYEQDEYSSKKKQKNENLEEKQQIPPMISIKLQEEDYDNTEVLEDIEYNTLVLCKTPEQQLGLVDKIFNKKDWYNKYSIDLNQFNIFLGEMKRKYNKRDNPFHNFLHGVSVMQCSYSITQFETMQKHFDDFDTFSIVFSALCHDVDHTGRSNNFEVASEGKLSLRYHDNSVLEQHHIATTFKLLLRYNVFKNMDKQQFKNLRKEMIKNILATDNSKHFQLLMDFEKIVEKMDKYNLGQMQKFEQQNAKEGYIVSINDEIETLSDCKQSENRITEQELKFIFEDKDKDLLTQVITHCSDFTGCAKPFRISKIWSGLLNQEFTAQYEQEGQLGLQQTPFFKDLDNPHIMSANEANFLSLFVLPTWKMLNQVTENQLKQQVNQIKDSILEWRSVQAENSPMKKSGYSTKNDNKKYINLNDSKDNLPLTKSRFSNSVTSGDDNLQSSLIKLQN